MRHSNSIPVACEWHHAPDLGPESHEVRYHPRNGYLTGLSFFSQNTSFTSMQTACDYLSSDHGTWSKEQTRSSSVALYPDSPLPHGEMARMGRSQPNGAAVDERLIDPSRHHPDLCTI